MLSSLEKVMVKLDSVKFKDESNEEVRLSLRQQFLRFGELSTPQFILAKKLVRRAKLRSLLAIAPPKWFYVYAIQAGEDIKVGYSHNPEARARDLQTGNAQKVEVVARLPCKTRLEAQLLERTIHDDGRRWNIRGEWFGYEILDLFR